MAVKKVRIKPPGYTDIVHPETDKDVVIGYKKASGVRFIVGTSTAGWTLQDCDYLCDGTDDQVEINNAITALPATGGEIIILDGTYNIAAKIDVTKDNVNLRGNGNSTILKRMFDSSRNEGVITLTGRSGCEIANLQVDGNKTNYTNDNNCGICLSASSNNTFTGNTCTDNNHGIYLFTSSSNNTITGNTCKNNNSYGIYLRSLNNTVIDNTCDNNSYGIYLLSSSDNTVIGNTCKNNSSGIHLLTSSDNNTITGNTCKNNNDGIRLQSSSNNTVTGNTCDNNGYGIYLFTFSHNNTVTGNTCNNNTDGIYSRSSNNSTFTGNTCNNNNYGIHLLTSSNNTVTGNTCIRGAGLTTDYTASQHTIRLFSTTNNYNLISNNNCMGKAPVVEGGIGNSVYSNKYDSGDYTDFTQDEKTKLEGIEQNANHTSNLTLNELTLGGRFKVVYNDIEDSLDFEVI